MAMAAAMALMESPPSSLAGVLCQRLAATGHWRRERRAAVLNFPARHRCRCADPLHESFTDGAQLLLLGGRLSVGLITGESGKAAMQPFSIDIQGHAGLLLLDMGLQAARSLAICVAPRPACCCTAVLGPLSHAGLALLLALATGLSAGNATLLMSWRAARPQHRGAGSAALRPARG
ncbi:MAG: sodium-dependent bicarbonate transport family permease [Uliginosibacterium sp.]|nr:sodium-dependent bicarbonate transport family permease [Uliginosibacterium sp.]